MSSLKVFWTPEQMAAALSALANEQKLSLLLFRSGEKRPLWKRSISSSDLAEAYQLFLAPIEPESAPAIGEVGDVKQRSWGWLNVRGGRHLVREAGEMLEKTEIHGEDMPATPVKPSKWVRWLDRYLKTALNAKRGVRVRSERSGGESLDKGPYHTDAAVTLLRKGVKWVENEGTSMIVYGPITE